MLHFIYPKLCVSCDKTLVAQEDTLCVECASLLPFTHYHHIPNNETAQRFAGRIKFEHATSLAYYTKEGLLQYLLQEFKYKGNLKIGIFLGKKLAKEIVKAGWANEIDIVVPVPLHTTKSKSRGYNQSEILAQQVADMLNISVNNKTLLRLRNTDSQTNKSRLERAENMKEAFSVTESTSFANKHVLILDDVLTTGATIEGCVAALSTIKGIKISIATIAVSAN